MKLTTLKLGFCLSLFVHGTVFSAVYAVKHVNASARPISAKNGDLSILEVLVEPESPVMAVSEPQPVAVKIPEPMPETISIKPEPTAIIPDAKPLLDAVETIPVAHRDDLAVAEEQPASTLLGPLGSHLNN
jgi:hypothetical protein